MSRAEFNTARVLAVAIVLSQSENAISDFRIVLLSCAGPEQLGRLLDEGEEPV
jgi:hypothetical protein